MNIKYFQNKKGEVFGYDVNDESQIVAMNNKLASEEFKEITETWNPVQINSKERNKALAIEMLFNTDWVNNQDVLLVNKDEFLFYRSLIRKIAIDPVEGDINWPNKPKAKWSK